MSESKPIQSDWQHSAAIRRRSFIMVFALVGVLGCDDKQKNEATPVVTSPISHLRLDPVDDAGVVSVGLELTSLGKKPHLKLRHTFRVGEAVLVRRTSSIRLTYPSERTVEKLDFVYRVRVVSLDAAGGARLEVTVPAKRAASQFGGRQFVVAATMTSIGRITSLTIQERGKVGQISDPRIIGLVQSLFTTSWLPRAAVGVGATWQILSTDVEVSIQVRRRVRLTLKARKDGLWRLERDELKTSPVHSVRVGEQTRRILERTVSAKGTIRYGVKVPVPSVPISFTSTSTTRQRMERPSGGVAALRAARVRTDVRVLKP